VTTHVSYISYGGTVPHFHLLLNPAPTATLIDF